MPKLVVIARDTSLSRAVAELAGDTLHVLGAASARSGINACCALEPACIVIEHDPPTIDGVTVARSLRRQPTAVVTTPIVLVVPSTATSLRTDALAEGVDVCLVNPVRPADVLGQCHALIAMARRLASSGAARRPAEGAERSAGSEAPPSTDRRPRALTGSLQRMPPTTVLAVLELEQRSGDLVLTGVPGSKKRLVVQLAAGLVVGGRLGSVSLGPVETMREALRWSGRRFEFAAAAPRIAPADASRLGPLLMEAMRSEPEGDLSELNSPPPSLEAEGLPPEPAPAPTSALGAASRGSGVLLRSLPPRRRSQPPPRRSGPLVQPEDEDVLEAENWASDAAASSTGEAP